MPFQSVPNTCLIAVVAQMAGQVIENTFYAQMDGYALGDVEALAHAVDGWVTDEWLPLMPSNYAYLRTDVRGLNAAIDLEASDATGAASGGAGAECPANNVALSVKRSSGFTGRGARGRIFVPLAANQIDPSTDTVVSTFAPAIIAILDALDATIVSEGWLPVIVHRVAAGVPLVPAVVFTLVEWVVVNEVIDSMRRRLPGRGA